MNTIKEKLFECTKNAIDIHYYAIDDDLPNYAVLRLSQLEDGLSDIIQENDWWEEFCEYLDSHVFD